MILLIVSFLLFIAGATTSYIARKEYNEWLYNLSAKLVWSGAACALIAVILLFIN